MLLHHTFKQLTYPHNRRKASLIGHSDGDGLTVTYIGNLFRNLNSRDPSFRFGTGHIFNNYYGNGINTG